MLADVIKAISVLCCTISLLQHRGLCYQNWGVDLRLYRGCNKKIFLLDRHGVHFIYFGAWAQENIQRFSLAGAFVSNQLHLLTFDPFAAVDVMAAQQVAVLLCVGRLSGFEDLALFTLTPSAGGGEVDGNGERGLIVQLGEYATSS